MQTVALKRRLLMFSCRVEVEAVACAGASFLPYLITDRVVAPDNCQHCYSEHLAYMPNCYFVNDYKAAHQDVLDEANLPTRSILLDTVWPASCCNAVACTAVSISFVK